MLKLREKLALNGKNSEQSQIEDHNQVNYHNRKANIENSLKLKKCCISVCTRCSRHACFYSEKIGLASFESKI